MITINVKEVSENDVLSPVGGKKVGDKIRQFASQSPVILDFEDSGSHTSLFFNAMFRALKGIANLQISKDILLKNETALDADTYQRSRDNFLSKTERA